MLKIGLTGQSGSGKGVFSCVFEKNSGCYSLDTDITARKVVEKGSDCLNELVGYFGKEILNGDGTINRRRLACTAFTDKEKHEKLNQITHFYILKEVEKWICDAEKKNAFAIVIDAPLLFESGADRLCDVTVGIIAPYDLRLRRITKRDGIDEKSAKIRLESQPRDEFFRERCDFVLENDSSNQEFEQKSQGLIHHIFNTYTERKFTT